MTYSPAGDLSPLSQLREQFLNFVLRHVDEVIQPATTRDDDNATRSFLDMRHLIDIHDAMGAP